MKNTITSRLLLGSVLFLFINIADAKSQSSTYLRRDDFAKVKTRSLIVMIESENPAVIGKLKKKHKEDKIPVYQQAVADYNQKMKEVVDQFWNVTRNVKYQTENEITALIKSRNKNFVVLRCITVSDGLDDARLDWTYTDFKDKNENDDPEYYKEAVSMRLDFIEDISAKGDIGANLFKHGDQTLVETGLPSVFPSNADLIYGVQVINWFLASIITKGKSPGFLNLKPDAAPLQTKTLLLRSDQIDPKLSEDDIKKLYPKKFRIVSKEEFDQYLTEKNAAFVFMEIIPEVDYISAAGSQPGTGSGQAMINHTVYDAETGGLVCKILPSVGGAFLGTVAGSKQLGKNYTDERVLKILAKM